LFTVQASLFVIQPNFSHESGAELTDKTAIKAFIEVMCLAGALRINNLEEFLCAKGNGTEKFRLIMNQVHFMTLHVPNHMHFSVN
jgi:hypothetical protein